MKSNITQNIKHTIRFSLLERTYGEIIPIVEYFDLPLLSSIEDGTFTRTASQYVIDYKEIFQINTENNPCFEGGRISGESWLATDENANDILEKSDYPDLHETTHVYIAGDKVYLDRFGLTCTVGGTSGGTAPTIVAGDVGSTKADGTVTWSVDGYATLKGYLNSEETTNLMNDPDDFTNWTESGGATGTGRVVTFGTGNSGVLGTTSSTISGTTITTSCNFIEKDRSKPIRIAFYINSVWDFGSDLIINDFGFVSRTKTVTAGQTITFIALIRGTTMSEGETLTLKENGGVQCEEKAYATSYAKTTRAATRLTYPVLDTLSVNDFSIEMEMTPSVAGQINTIFSSYSNATNYFSIESTATQIIIKKVLAGVTHNAIFTYTHLVNTFFTLKAIVSTARGIELSINKGTVVTDTNTTDCVLGTTFDIGSKNSIDQFNGAIKNIKIYDEDKGNAWLTE